MGDERVTRITNKHGKKKIHLISSLSNGGEARITGLLVFGGALAVAGFMAVVSFASNKNKVKGKSARHHSPKPKTQDLLLDDGCKTEEDDQETTQSLCSLLHDSTTQDGDAICCSSCWTSNKSINQINSSELLSAQTLILDEKIEQEESPTSFHHQEIALSEDSHPESATSSNEIEVEGECSESLSNNACFQAQEADKDEPQYGLKSIEIETEDDYISEDDDDDMECDDVSESSEEDSSNATGSTSLDSNEEPEQELKGGITDIQSEEHGTAKTNIVSASADECDSLICSGGNADGSDYSGNEGAMSITPEATSNEKAFSLVLNDQPSALRTWVIPMLLLALMLLLVLLTHRPPGIS